MICSFESFEYLYFITFLIIIYFQYLTDIRVTSKPLPDLCFTLEFHFAPNEFFTDTVLTKEYLMKCTPDPEDPFSFDGPEIYKSRGCEIHWKEGKDLTVKTVKKKHQLCQDRGICFKYSRGFWLNSDFILF